MKTFWTSIVAFGLIIWPIILLQHTWAAHRANVHYVPPDFVNAAIVSWLVGTVVAICGTMISEENSPKLRSFGKNLCIITLCVDAVVLVVLFVYVMRAVTKLTAHDGSF